MSDLLEEEVWRLPKTAKSRDIRTGLPRSSSLSPAAKARLRRIVNKAPEAMVKLTGRTRGAHGHLKAHFDYLTRHGRLEGELQDGTPITTRDELRALHDDWLLANALNERGRPKPDSAQSVSLILSMPPGTPANCVEAAARSWARETFNGTHDWLLVRHNDRDHPHVHISVRAVGHDGRRLAPGPADLRQWRERFARELRRLGVEAEATPRQARGIVPKSSRSALYTSEARGVEPRIRTAEKREVQKAAQASPTPQPWERRIQGRQEAIRSAYLEHAALLASGNADDQLLARDIRRFVAELPVPLTRRQAIAIELRRVLDRHPGRGLQPERTSVQDLHSANPAARLKTDDRSEPDNTPSNKSENPRRSR